LIVISYLTHKKITINSIKKKIKKMNVERDALEGLIKKTQIERYKKNNISGLVYNIRVKKYESRIEEIKQELPVLESKLKKNQKKSSKKKKSISKKKKN
jgi:hypothetical protein